MRAGERKNLSRCSPFPPLTELTTFFPYTKDKLRMGVEQGLLNMFCLKLHNRW